MTAPRISRDSPAAMQAASKASPAMRRELEAIRAQDGDEVALGHASGAMMAAGDFIAYDLGQPETARSTFNFYSRRMDVTLPITPAAPATRDETWESIVAHNAEDLTSALWEAQRLLGGPASLALADATIRATLRFLVETYHDDHTRGFVEGLGSEVGKLIADRNAMITAPRQ